MYSIHWPKLHWEKAEKAERPPVPVDSEGRELRRIGTVITVLYVAVILAAWSVMTF